MSVSPAHCAPVVLGEDRAAVDISGYMGRMDARLRQEISQKTDGATDQGPGRPVDVDQALMALTDARFPILPGNIALRDGGNAGGHVGAIAAHPLKLPIRQDICVIGTDDYSIYWLSKAVQENPRLRLCFVIEVEDADTLEKWRSALQQNQIQLFPINGALLSERHGVSFYPVVLEAKGG